MRALVGSGWGRGIYLWLTTSQRDRRNRLDDVSGHITAARRERDKIQLVNDVFHTAGRGAGRPLTMEGITLQGRGEGMAWGFLLLPAALTVALLLFITQASRGDRLAEQLAAEAAWQAQWREAAEKKAAADAALRVAQEESGEMRAALSGLAEEEVLATQLERNLSSIREHLQRDPSTNTS